MGHTDDQWYPQRSPLRGRARESLPATCSPISRARPSPASAAVAWPTQASGSQVASPVAPPAAKTSSWPLSTRRLCLGAARDETEALGSRRTRRLRLLRLPLTVLLGFRLHAVRVPDGTPRSESRWPRRSVTRARLAAICSRVSLGTAASCSCVTKAAPAHGSPRQPVRSTSPSCARAPGRTRSRPPPGDHQLAYRVDVLDG
jgi:hypothetical protein